MQALKITVMLSLLLTLGASSVLGQSLGNFDIPFEFTIGQKTLPAGDYVVSRVSIASTGTLLIQNRENHAAAWALTYSVQERANEGRVQLVFHRYGNEHFLSQVWSGGALGRELRTPRMEDLPMTSESHPQVEVILAQNF